MIRARRFDMPAWMARPTRIVSASAVPLDVAMRKAFGISGGAQVHAHNVLVRVTLASGDVGYGEAAPFPAFNGETQETALAALAPVMSVLVGEDAREGEALTSRFDLRSSASARCALETAVVDALAREARVPLVERFGGRERSLVTDVTVTTGTADEARADALAHPAFRTLKIKVGGYGVDHDVTRVLAIAAARPDAALFLDANGGFTVEEAVELARVLAARGVRLGMFEQPVAAGSFEALAEVRAKTGLPVALDESVASVDDVARAAAARAGDAVNVKIMKSGVFEAVRIAEAARAHGLRLMIGGLVETRLAMGTSAAIAAGMGGFDVVDLDTPLFLAEDPFEGGFAYRGDVVDLAAVEQGHGCTPRRVPS